MSSYIDFYISCDIKDIQELIKKCKKLKLDGGELRVDDDDMEQFGECIEITKVKACEKYLEHRKNRGDKNVLVSYFIEPREWSCNIIEKEIKFIKSIELN